MPIRKPNSKQPIPENAEVVFKGILFDVYQWEQELYDGTKKTFEKLKRPDTVIVLPVLPDGKILLIKEQQPLRDLSLSEIGGRVDEGEDILEAAKRELLEETGYEAKEFISWYVVQSTTKIEHYIYVFIAKGLKKVAEPNPDGGEKIELVPTAFADFINLAMNQDSLGRELRLKVFEAQHNQEKKKELEELFGV